MKKFWAFLNNNRWLLIAILSFFIGLAIRFYYALNTDLWGDEAISYFISKRNSYSDLFFSKGDYLFLDHPPLYYIFLKIMLIFNNAEWWLRLTSLIWFFPSVYLVYKISSFFQNRNSTYLSISLFSLHPLLINSAFQVRSYAMIIFFMLLTIYLVSLNLKQPKLFRSFLIGVLLTVCFFTNYASIWLIAGLFFFMIYLFLSKRKLLAQNLLYSLCVFIVTGFLQIHVLVNYFLESKTQHLPFTHSVPFFNVSWIIYQLQMLFGNDYLEFYIPLFLVINIFNLQKNKSLLNPFFFFLSLTTVVLSVITSVFLFPNFVARQLVLFTLVSVFIFAQFHQKTSQKFVLIITLLLFTINSLNAYEFLFLKNIESNIQDQIVSNSTVLATDNYDVINYYLEINNINSPVYSIEEELINQDLKNKLLALPSQKMFFVINDKASDADLKLKQDLQNSICDKHHCSEIEL